MSERLSRTARWYSTGQIASRNPPPPASDARSPGAAFLAEHGRDDGDGLRGFLWRSLLEGQPLALAQRRTPPRRHAPSGSIHLLWLKTGALNSQEYVSNWAS